MRVVPKDVGIAVEVAGATPARFYTSRSADIETDSDEEGGFCLVQAKSSGPMRVSFDDTKNRLSHTHLFFTEPISQLIEARAQWIVGQSGSRRARFEHRLRHSPR